MIRKRMDNNLQALGASTRKWAAWLFVAVVAVACAATFKPFSSAIVWGLALAIACEPLARTLTPKLGTRLRASVAIVAGLSLAVALPLGFAIAAAASQVGWAFEWARQAASMPWPEPPSWLLTMQMLGPWIAASWDTLAKTGGEAAIAMGRAPAGEAAAYAAIVAGGIGALAVHAGLALIVSGMAMANASAIDREVQAATRRVFGERAQEWIALAASAVRGVAMGVCGTALCVSIVVAAGLAIVGVPAVSLLACLAMALCLAQIGPLPILAPVAIFLAANGRYGAAAFIVVLTVALSIVDGIMRPVLIGREIKMSMLLIFVGVVGGLMSFGMLGLFIGPMALAMGAKLWKDWRGNIS